MKVLVTGASGYLGRLIIPALLQRGDTTSVVGVDKLAAGRGPHGRDPRYTHIQLDLTQARYGDWEHLLTDIELVYHLAFCVAPRPGEDARGINLDAQEPCLTVCLARARRVIVASAVSVYGFGPGRDVVNGLDDEQTPFTPNAGVDYVEHKQRLEQLLDRLAPNATAELVRARPTNVVGPGMWRERAPLLVSPAVFAPLVSHPIRQQMLYEEDLTRAMLHLLEVAPGAYNIAPDDWFTFEEAATLLGKRYVRMPAWALRGLSDVAWRTGQSAFDPSWMTFLERPPIIVTNAKLRATGWAPRFTSRESLMLLAGAFS